MKVARGGSERYYSLGERQEKFSRFECSQTALASRDAFEKR
jgi:hypothetical protein